MNKYSVLCPVVSSTISSRIRNTLFFLCTSSLTSITYAYSTIDQTGNGHLATIEQSQGYQTGAHITQSGESNNASISQTIVFHYTDNEIHQAGESNDAFIEQRNLQAGFASAGAASTGTGNLIQILQSDQLADNIASAEAVQIGDGNQATIIQQNNETGSLTANIFQEGQDNAAWIYQIGVGTSGADIQQIGDNNQSTVNQTMTMGAYGIDGQVSVHIAGSGNDLTISQSDAEGSSVSYVQSGDGSVAEIDQSGYSQLISISNENTHYNSDVIYQTAFAGSIFVSRIGGNENETNIHQASHGGEIIVEQVESNNVRANVNQENFRDWVDHEAAILQTRSEHSIASIEQSGNSTRATIVQTDAMSSEASIQQLGWDHSAEITQVMGVDNYALILQNGDGSGAAISQAGNSNYAMITQM